MRSTSTCLLLALTLQLLSQATWGAEWWMEPNIALRLGYNDNINLTTNAHDAVFESALTPGISFGMRTENRGISGTTKVQIQRFTGGDGRESSDRLNRENALLDLDLFNQTETGMFSTKLELDRDDTLETANTTTGQVTDRVSRDRLTITPRWTRTLTRNTLFTAKYSFFRIEFGDEVPVTKLVEYDYHVVSGTLVHNLNPLTQATLAASFNVYDPRDQQGNDSLYLQAGLSREFSETLSGQFLAGIRRTTIEFDVPTGFCVGAPPGAAIPDCNGKGFVQTGIATDETSDNGLVFSAGITHKHETGRNSLSVSRLSTPSIEGGLLDTFNVQAASDLGLTRTLVATLIASYVSSESIENTTSGAIVYDVESFRARPGLRWRWSRSLVLGAGYEHVRSLNNQSQDAEVATRNAIFISLEYTQPRRSVSR